MKNRLDVRKLPLVKASMICGDGFDYLWLIIALQVYKEFAGFPEVIIMTSRQFNAYGNGLKSMAELLGLDTSTTDQLKFHGIICEVNDDAKEKD